MTVARQVSRFSVQATDNIGAPKSYKGVPEKCWSVAFLIRKFEQRLLSLFSEGRLSGTVHTSIGQEFTGIAVAHHLRPEDLIFSNHRCHGHYLARTGDVEGLMAEIMGRSSGVCGGRGGSQHICGHGFFSNGVQGGIVPVATGLALAQKLRSSGITVAFIGDGTLGEGAVYECFNLASCWELPLVIVLENNLYAQSTSQRETLSGGITQRAQAFGIRAYRADVWTPSALLQTAGEAVQYARETGQPAFLQVDTYRLMAHSKGDDNRDSEEVGRYWSIDPIVRFAEERPEQAARFEADADLRVSDAVEFAMREPFTTPTVQREEIGGSALWSRTRIPGEDRLVNRIYSALRSGMGADPLIFCLGEDIEGPYGGAFKVTKDLSQLFPGRVRNTPISEAAIVGVACGLAIAGHRPVAEIMFGDFLTLAADQIINHAAKFHYMYNEKVSVPMIIRAPMGGKRGYGPTHSQSLEKHFLGVPGTRVLAVHHRYDPALVFDRLFATIDRPTLVIENKILYGERVSDRAPEGFVWEHTGGDFPVSRLRPGAAPDLTIVCYGGALIDVERAVDRLFEEREIIAEVLCPIEIYPLRLSPLLSSVLITRRLLIVEEGQSFCGFGAEVVAAVNEHAPGALVKVKRLGAAPSAIPASKPAESAMLPSVESIINAATEVSRV